MMRFGKQRDRGRALSAGPPPRPRTQARGLGDVPNPVTLTTRELQQALVRAGYDIGPTGVDGRWGERTGLALKRFILAHFQGVDADAAYQANASTQHVLLTQNIWNGLQHAAPGSGGEQQSSGGGSSGGGSGSSGRSGSSGGGSSSGGGTGSSAPPNVPAPSDEPGVLQNPWLWGGVALLVTAGIAYVATRPSDEDADAADTLVDAELLPTF